MPQIIVELADLASRRAELRVAQDRYDRQLVACVVAGHSSIAISKAIGVKPNVVRSLKAWREGRK